MSEPGLRCKYHGGKSLKGSASPRFQDGRWSKYMPLRLLEKYNEAANDPELLAVRLDFSLLDSRIADLLTRVDAGDSAALFDRASEAFRGFKSALDRNDAETMKIHLQTLDRLLAQGKSDYAAWEDIRTLMEQRRKMIETEMRRLEKMQQFVTAEEVAALGHGLQQHLGGQQQPAAFPEEVVPEPANPGPYTQMRKAPTTPPCLSSLAGAGRFVIAVRRFRKQWTIN